MRSFFHPPESEEYYTFVGVFVVNYAMLEDILRRAVRLLSGLETERFQILVAQPRSGDLIRKAKQLSAVGDLSETERAMVDCSFEHLVDLSALRDRVVHYYPATFVSGEVTILGREAGDDAPTHLTTTMANLWAAAEDLDELTYIFSRLLAREAPIYPKVGRRPSWRYKPSQPAQGRRPTA